MTLELRKLFKILSKKPSENLPSSDLPLGHFPGRLRICPPPQIWAALEEDIGAFQTIFPWWIA